MRNDRIINLELDDDDDDGLKGGLLKSAYTYPNKDFCLFKEFPHTQLVAALIKLGQSDIKCSCTLIWLHKYQEKYFIEKKDNKTYALDICLKEANNSSCSLL